MLDYRRVGKAMGMLLKSFRLAGHRLEYKRIAHRSSQSGWDCAGRPKKPVSEDRT
jgi:hypothetical protein